MKECGTLLSENIEGTKVMDLGEGGDFFAQLNCSRCDILLADWIDLFYDSCFTLLKQV